ncbi:MAG TPA: ATP synthase F1 subunit delta [Pseudomonadota bacterium]|nr:ATP synthase F1 subunit delta [Pseudomonadota bacterium]
MLSGSVSRRYARAVVSIGEAEGNLEVLAAEVGRLAEAVEQSADLRTVLLNPAFSQSQRQQVLEHVCARLALSKTSQNLAKLLLARGRMANVPGIAKSLRQMVDDVAGRVRVRLASAAPLDEATEVRIRSALGRATGKTVIVEKTVDASLLGGVVAQVGDLVYDGSLRGELRNLRARWQQ